VRTRKLKEARERVAMVIKGMIEGMARTPTGIRIVTAKRLLLQHLLDLEVETPSGGLRANPTATEVAKRVMAGGDETASARKAETVSDKRAGADPTRDQRPLGVKSPISVGSMLPTRRDVQGHVSGVKLIARDLTLTSRIQYGKR